MYVNIDCYLTTFGTEHVSAHIILTTQNKIVVTPYKQVYIK